MLSLSASAVQYDANNDGVVNSDDVLFIQKYLSGLIDVTNLSKLDINQNHIVDKVDVSCLTTSILGGTFQVNNISEQDDIMNVTSTTSTTYYKHFCSSTDLNSYTPYTLSQNLIDNSTSSTSYSFSDVFEPDALKEDLVDNRVQLFSYPKYIVKILCNGSFMGTGFIVNDGIIATSAHCIYNTNQNKFYNNISIVLFNANGTVAQTLSAEELHIPSQFTSSYSYMYDYGLIYVDNNLTNYPRCNLGTFINTPSTVQEEIPVTTLGFPEDKNNTAIYHSLWSSSGEINYNINAHNFGASVYSYSGQSGSPVYHTTNYTLNASSYSDDIVIGILRGAYTTSSTTCKSFTAPVLRFYKNNSYVG